MQQPRLADCDRANGSHIPEGAGRVKGFARLCFHFPAPSRVPQGATNEVGVKMERPECARTNDLDADEEWRRIDHVVGRKVGVVLLSMSDVMVWLQSGRLV